MAVTGRTDRRLPRIAFGDPEFALKLAKRLFGDDALVKLAGIGAEELDYIAEMVERRLSRIPPATATELAELRDLAERRRRGELADPSNPFGWYLALAPKNLAHSNSLPAPALTLGLSDYQRLRARDILAEYEWKPVPNGTPLNLWAPGDRQEMLDILAEAEAI